MVTHIKRSLSLTLVLMVFLLASACNHTAIAFNKRYLQDPLMDPAKTSDLGSSAIGKVYSAHEIGASDGVGSSSGTCPTCGG